MYSINRQETINPDFDMINRIVDKLNSKFDPNDAYHHSNAESEMFEFQMKIDDKRREAWQIVFMGHHTVASGSFFGFDYSDCQEEEYITLEGKNERKIYIMIVTSVCVIGFSVAVNRCVRPVASLASGPGPAAFQSRGIRAASGRRPP